MTTWTCGCGAADLDAASALRHRTGNHAQPFSSTELKNVTQSTAIGHGNGGGTAEWNGRWLATLARARSIPETPETVE